MVPSKSIPILSSIPPEDATCLQYLYSNDTNILCGSVKLDVLARMYARVFGPSMAHEGLRNMTIALLKSNSGTNANLEKSRFPTESEQLRVDVVLKGLRQKLANPIELEESDIFVAYMLAIWSSNIDDDAAEVHIKGIIAIMRHVSRRLGSQFSTSPMGPFWAMLRDEILWRTRKSSNRNYLFQRFREILGPKTIQQRHHYENELRGAMIPTSNLSNSKVFYGRTMYSSVHSLMEAARIIHERFPIQNALHDPIIESVLVELHVEEILLEQKGHESLLALELKPLQIGDYLEDWRVELTVIERFHDLIALYVCRIVTISLESPSIRHGLASLEGMAASASLISTVRRARDFVHAGIKGERVFGTGMSTRLLRWG